METGGKKKRGEYESLQGFNEGSVSNGITGQVKGIRESANGSKNMIFGLLWIVAGLCAVLYFSYHSILGAGYVLPILAIFFGVVQFFKGVMEYLEDED